MPYLGDFLGHLLAEITIARSQADIESIRIAEMYVNHPLLKHFSVPRFRLPDITIDLPIAVSEMEESKEGSEPRGKLMQVANLEQPLNDSVIKTLKDHDIELSKEQEKSISDNFRKSLPLILKDTTKIKEIPTNLTHIAEKLTVDITKELDKDKTVKIDNEKMSTVQRALRHSLRGSLLTLMEKPPRLKVLVTSKELQEYKDPERIIHLRLSVSEEAVEWTTIDIDGQQKERLITE